MDITKDKAKQALKDIWYRALDSNSVTKFDSYNKKLVAKKRYQEKHDMLDKLIEDYFELNREFNLALNQLDRLYDEN